MSENWAKVAGLLCCLALTVLCLGSGYAAKASAPINPDRNVPFAAEKEEPAPPPITVSLESFVSGVSISGKVTGLKADQTNDYKVLVYLRTDKWSIHPFAEDKEGKGYASLKEDGTWTIPTVDRGQLPFSLAILVVPRDVIAPAVVALKENEKPEQTLKTAIGTSLKASLIQKPPAGLKL